MEEVFEEIIMPVIFIYSPRSTKAVKEDIEQDLLWYDGEKQEMVKFRGGKLDFIYAYDVNLQKYRLLPKVGRVTATRYEISANKNAVLDTINSFTDVNDSSKIAVISENDFEGWIECDVPQNEFENFTEELEDNNIDFRIGNA